MQVANALNNSIRILFNPRVESFKLFDFLIVKSDDNKYLSQIVEIYDDKFDSSQNVAKIKLFYKINQNNEVMPYDNFTPNRECEIIKINQEEIENFINQDKKTFIFGTNTKSSCALNVQYDFFNNGSVVLADKIENSTAITLNLAKNLSSEKNVVIIDPTGVIEFEDAKKITASKDFKMPLNYKTIDFVYDKCLADASLEFQSIGGEIINEIKKFAKNQENGFIPFNSFVKVLLEQYKATPYSELKLLLTRIKKHQMDILFARTKRENEILTKTTDKNSITIIDLSSLEYCWKKPFIEYILSAMEKDIYLIMRINDDNFDVEFINEIYCKKKNINFIPIVPYSYKKLPSLMQYCKNYILMPSLYQRMDFLDANFALSNLISDGCLIFGKNTDDFIYLACDYALESQDNRKNYRKLNLNLDNGDKPEAQNPLKNGDYYENQQDIQQNNDKLEIKRTDSERLMQELSDIEEQKQEEFDNSNETIEIEQDDTFETADIVEEPQTPEENEEEISHDEFQELTDDTQKEVQNSKHHDEFQELTDEAPLSENETIIEQEQNIELDEPDNSVNQSFEEILKEDENKSDAIQPSKEKEDENSNLVTFEELDSLSNETSADTKPKETQEEAVNLSDEELDFFQLAQETSKEHNEIEQAKKSADSTSKNDVDLTEMANSSIDNNFEKIINKKPELPLKSEIEKDTKIDIDKLSDASKKENLPIFKEEEKNENTKIYSVGNVVYHKKYGRGTVVKTIKYEQRQLLQIEFDESGKKLLDPKVADLKLE